MCLPFQGNISLGFPRPWADLGQHLLTATQTKETLFVSPRRLKVVLRSLVSAEKS